MADTKVIKTQADVIVDFGGGDITYNDPFIVWEKDDVPDVEQSSAGVIRLRNYSTEHFVAIGESLQDLRRHVVTKGTLERTQEVRLKRIEGNIEFSGTERVKLPYPVLNAGVYSGLDLFRAIKSSLFYNQRGDLIDPSIVLDWVTGELVAAQACYGGVEYSYTTSYRIYRYRPSSQLLTSSVPVFGALPGVPIGVDFIDAVVWNDKDYGTLMSFSRAPEILGPDGTVLGVPPPPIVFKISPPETPNIEFELYRIESTVIVNEDGTWEKPLGWPTNGDYPGTDTDIDVNANHLEMKRVHEIAYFSLQNVDIKNANDKSQYMNVPLSFKKLDDRAGRITMIRNPDSTVAFDNPSDEYKRRVRDFPIPRMRVVRFERPLEKPYEGLNGTNKWPDTERQVMPVATTLSGKVIQSYIELTKTFKIKLTVTPGRAPRNGQAELDQYDKDGRDKSAEEYRKAVANNQLYRAWNAIDWKAIRQMIRAQYPNWQYAFDAWTFPGETEETV